MGRNKTTYLNEAEQSFSFALKMVGISLTIENTKLAYRLAIYSQQKKGDISLKEVAAMASIVENENNPISTTTTANN